MAKNRNFRHQRRVDRDMPGRDIRLGISWHYVFSEDMVVNRWAYIVGRKAQNF
jgi:hypothetical protein